MDDIPLAQPIFDIHLKATEYDLDLAFEHLRDTIALRYAYPNARLTLNYALAGMKNLFNPDFDESDGAGDYTQEGYGGPDFFILNVFPTQEEYEAIWAKALEISPDNPKGTLSDALFELDHMGLRAAGAAYFETYRKDIGYDEPDNPAYLARKQALKR